MPKVKYLKDKSPTREIENGGRPKYGLQVACRTFYVKENKKEVYNIIKERCQTCVHCNKDHCTCYAYQMDSEPKNPLPYYVKAKWAMEHDLEVANICCDRLLNKIPSDCESITVEQLKQYITEVLKPRVVRVYKEEN